MAERRATVSLAVLVVALAGCFGPDVTEPVSPSATPDEEPPRPSPSVSASPDPTPVD